MLVIIGLLVGGIIAGKSLIRASEVKGTIIDMQRYRSALQAFKDQYNAWPGDMINATNYWGSAGGSSHTNDDTCYSIYKTTQATCNGNGDGLVADTGGANPSNTHERFLVWQHLANAGLIAGQYTGRSTASGNIDDVGVNVPATKLSASLFDVYSATGNNGVNNFTDTNPVGLEISLFGFSATDALKPAEAFQVDTKFDDGKPGYGKIYTFKKSSPAGGNCVTSDTASTAEYDLSNASTICDLLWNL